MIYGPYILSFYHFIRDEQVKNYIKNNNNKITIYTNIE